MNGAASRCVKTLSPKNVLTRFLPRVFVRPTSRLDVEHVMFPCLNLRNRECLSSLHGSCHMRCGEKQLRVFPRQSAALGNSFSVFTAAVGQSTATIVPSPPPVARPSPSLFDSGRSRRRRGSWFRQSQAICTAQQKQPEESCDFHSDPVQLPPMMPYHDAIPCHRHATCHTTRVMSNGAQGRRGESQISSSSRARRLIIVTHLGF